MSQVTTIRSLLARAGVGPKFRGLWEAEELNQILVISTLLCSYLLISGNETKKGNLEGPCLVLSDINNRGLPESYGEKGVV